ncbi:MAG: hypothetical protein ACRDWS_12265 [Acidimicrobiia bacterium]
MRRWMTLLLLFGLISACGGGGVASDPETTEDAAESETLGDFFGWAEEDPEAAEVQYREQEARVQEAIRQCMAKAGFEYQPVLPPDAAFGVAGEEFDEEEWVRTQGFGITTWYGNEEAMTETTMAVRSGSIPIRRCWRPCPSRRARPGMRRSTARRRSRRRAPSPRSIPRLVRSSP